MKGRVDMTSGRLPFPWVRKIASRIEESNQIPLFGNAPSFDWLRFSSLISSRFAIHNFSIREATREWRPAHTLSRRVVIPLHLSPIEGEVFWVMTSAEAKKLATYFARGQSKGSLLPSDLADGFYRYLLLQSIDCLHSIDPLQKLSIEMDLEGVLPESDLLCVDVELSLDEKPVFGTIAISPDFHRNWIHHFSAIPSSLSKHAMNIELMLSVDIGSVEIEAEEWGSLKLGDAIVLDKGSYEPRKEMGAATVTWQGIPLFQARIKHHKIELVEPSSAHEAMMTKKGHESQTLQNTPVLITVELAKIQMALGKLMQLSPGNVLELPIHPEQLVSLTVNGEVVAKGELVQLGDTLSVRIISL